MLLEIVICTVSDTPEFAPVCERESKLEVCCSSGIESELFLSVISCTELFFLDAKADQPVVAECLPVIEPLKVCAGFAEELKFHLLELTCSEDEVAGCDLVTERLTDLADTERKLLSCRTLNVCEVNEDTLSCLRSQINFRCCILGNTDECLEHKVELTDIREVVAAAYRAGNVVVPDVSYHLFGAHTFNRYVLDSVLLVPILNEVICSLTCLALLAVDERIGETADVA